MSASSCEAAVTMNTRPARVLVRVGLVEHVAVEQREDAREHVGPEPREVHARASPRSRRGSAACSSSVPSSVDPLRRKRMFAQASLRDLAARHHPGAVGGAAEVDRAGPLDEGLVEVEERCAARIGHGPRVRCARWTRPLEQRIRRMPTRPSRRATCDTAIASFAHDATLIEPAMPIETRRCVDGRDAASGGPAAPPRRLRRTTRSRSSRWPRGRAAASWSRARVGPAAGAACRWR